MVPEKSQIREFSAHLFWDIDPNKLDIGKSKKTIIQRVLVYGLLKDWQLLVKIYGIDEIAATASTLRDLDQKSATFISLISGLSLNQFRCFTLRPSMPKHCNF